MIQVIKIVTIYQYMNIFHTTMIIRVNRKTLNIDNKILIAKKLQFRLLIMGKMIKKNVYTYILGRGLALKIGKINQF